nr:hypothetical protein 17 [bacterium]
MSSVTLLESAKLSQDQLVSGVIENVITVNKFYQHLPFLPIEGNALAYNRENALGDVQFAGVGTTITAKSPATFTQVTSSLTSLLGDAEVNGLIQATRSNIQDQKAIQVASKAKSVGRQYQDTMINGDGTSETFQGLLSLVAAGQTITGDTADGDALSFGLLDELLDKVDDKDGEVDYILMNSRTLRSYLGLLRGLGGASIGDVITLPDGSQIPAYRNIPIFRNDYIPTDQTKGATSTCTSVVAGTLDDGSMQSGIAGLTAMDASGIQVEEVGTSETKDETITRVKWYCGLALFSEKGLAALTGITN